MPVVPGAASDRKSQSEGTYKSGKNLLIECLQALLTLVLSVTLLLCVFACWFNARLASMHHQFLYTIQNNKDALIHC